MTREDFECYRFKDDLAMLLIKEVKTLKEKPKCVFFSYKSLSEVLVKYDINSDSIISILQFKSGKMFPV